MKHIAVVPVKDKSDRVGSKNFRDFVDGKSLLEIKIDQLISSGCYEDIFVSSDSDLAREIAKKMSVRFVERDKIFCNNIAPWSDVIVNVLESIPVAPDSVVSWCHVTSPTFDLFSEAVLSYESKKADGYDGLIAVNRFNEFLVTQRARPYNYSWGRWHEYSQDLEPLYRISGALFMAPKRVMLENKYVASLRPYLFETQPYQAVDIDTEYDFKLAKMLYQNREVFDV